MAVRPVYEVKESIPFFSCVNVEFEWNGGFARSQKQKNIRALHDNYQRRHDNKRVLEISSKSMQEGGEALSAFFLPKYVPALEKSVPVECVFQSGKTFLNGGPYKDLLNVTPREAKKDERLKSSGRLTGFMFEGKVYPLIPKTIFYDYIYINALLENEELAKIALQYDAFTDIEFNPEKSINCQAKACATFVALSKLGLVNRVREFDSFLALYGVEKKIPEKENTVVERAEKEEIKVKPGYIICHKKYGEGVVLNIEGTILTVNFPEVGEKKLGLNWCVMNCEIKK